MTRRPALTPARSTAVDWSRPQPARVLAAAGDTLDVELTLHPGPRYQARYRPATTTTAGGDPSHTHATADPPAGDCLVLLAADGLLYALLL